MASKIQRIVTQARATFGKRGPDQVFTDEFQRLKDLVNVLTAADFNLSQRETEGRWDYLPYVQDSPASCMEIYECPEFSVGIFLLKPKKKMPLHDHPGMHGIMKVVLGSMTVTSYSKLKNPHFPEDRAKRTPIPCKFSSSRLLDTSSEPCVLHPEAGNIHQIQANDTTVAFIDILAPPYNPKEGRDCTYYERLDGEERKDEKSIVRLMPGPNPSWFACVPLAYDGPRPT